ncbi:scytalone dehydratase [Chaetomium sp. MPI-CAGE-AT-0009]|nr:scytalone dehydratase [Chaetomium sp. MPI-CAGE-AT-0009]
MASEPSFQDILGCQSAAYEWAESYDTKDWARLLSCTAPTLRVDYRSFLNKLWDAMPAEAFVAMASDPKVLGDPRLKTQHFVGVSKWVKVSETEITGCHQMRVAHQKYADEKLTEVAARVNAHGRASIFYRKVDGVWKFAGIEPDIRWSSGNHDELFQDGEDKFGEGARASSTTDSA